MAAPTTSVMPIWIQLPRAGERLTIGDVLQAVQRQSTQLSPMEPSETRCITQAGPDAAQALGFQTMLIVYPEDPESDGLLVHGHFGGWDKAADLALAVLCELAPTTIKVPCQFDPEVLSDA